MAPKPRGGTIVDFVGLPGAGKTTLVHAVAERMNVYGIAAAVGENGGGTTVEGRPLRGWAGRVFGVAALVGNPGLTAACGALVVGGRHASLTPMFVNLCRRDRALRRSRPRDLLLLHESSFHRLCIALALTGHTSPRTIERFVRRMAWPDALVVLEVGPATAAERVRRRLMRIDPALAAIDASAPMIEGWRERYAAVAEGVAAVVEPTIPVLRLDGSTNDVAALAARVRAWWAAHGAGT